MNKAQITNLLVAVITASCGAWLTKNGIQTSDVAKDVSDLVAVGAAIGTWWMAHKYHGNNPPSAPV